MAELKRVTLPGVGVMHLMHLDAGGQVGVISHRSGVVDLVTLSDDDEDRCTKTTLRLDEDESHTVAELLGGTDVTESLDNLRILPGLSIDWYTVDAGDHIEDEPLGSLPEFGVFGVTVVAVVRGGQASPAPAPDFVVHADDTLILAGTPVRVRKCFDYYRVGTLDIPPKTGTIRTIDPTPPEE
jgi:TrkA domain protein